jgi:hypothetical protein
MRCARCVVLATTVAILLVNTVLGQGLTGSIYGNVTDPSGAAIANADITLTNVATSQVRTTKADGSGDFIFTQLLPGTFRLTISASGFRKYEQSDIVLTATERVDLQHISLQLGDVSQTVEVTAEAARLQTQSAERSGLISTDQTQNIPLKGRDYIGLLKLLPGVVDNQNRNAPGWNNLSNISINGNRTGTVNLTLDGVSSLDTGSMTGPYLAPSMDALRAALSIRSSRAALDNSTGALTISCAMKR